MADNREERLLFLCQDMWVFYSPHVRWWVQIKLWILNHNAWILKKVKCANAIIRGSADFLTLPSASLTSRIPVTGKTDYTIFAGVEHVSAEKAMWFSALPLCVCKNILAGEGLDIQIFCLRSINVSIYSCRKKQGRKFSLQTWSHRGVCQFIFQNNVCICTHTCKHREMFPFGLQDFHYFLHNSPSLAQENKLKCYSVDRFINRKILIKNKAKKKSESNFWRFYLTMSRVWNLQPEP